MTFKPTMFQGDHYLRFDRPFRTEQAQKSCLPFDRIGVRHPGSDQQHTWTSTGLQRVRSPVLTLVCKITNDPRSVCDCAVGVSRRCDHKNEFSMGYRLRWRPNASAFGNDGTFAHRPWRVANPVYLLVLQSAGSGATQA